MFLLIIILFITTQTGEMFTKSTVLDTFEDWDACVKKAKEINADMKMAYPNESDYVVTCTINDRSRRGV